MLKCQNEVLTDIGFLNTAIICGYYALYSITTTFTYIVLKLHPIKNFSLSIYIYIYIHTYMSPLLVVFHQPAVGGEWCLATHLLCGFAQRRLRRSVVSFNACGSACALVVATRHHLT